ncbi:Glucan endo-1,3-beta-glucosidase, acidic isoform [Triticum urartu]|uniref:Glucan endo-1,3-beta-D-glucosidase n=2 Tax=Triticum TaxID=4564 RepID=A0A9R0VRS6_TRITD|nr:Glucan endo-1,3-beta-glucosidase, acidic isoform [Triticum urartu]VAH68976.1 unnamed protein product [Triticum turgidum subsp. durum]
MAGHRACMFSVALALLGVLLASIPAGNSLPFILSIGEQARVLTSVARFTIGKHTEVQSIGVCYGVNGDGLPSASEVVQLYQSNGITGMRIYFPDADALQALSGSNIGLIIDYLATTGAPLLANVYPYFSYVDNQAQIDINYALFTSPGTVVQDGGNAYQNLFDALVDTFYSALESAGAGSVNVVVSESGWPSAGGTAATTDNAQTYNQNLIKHVGQGTPKRPSAIEAYVFAMFNEDKKGPAEIEKHFGLFNPDKSPAYPISF